MASPGRPLGAVGKHKPARAALERLVGQGGTNPKLLDDIWYAIAIKASRGDVMAAQLICDRLDGKVPHTVGQSDEHGPITVVVTGVRRHEDIIDVEPEPPLRLVSND